MPKEGKDLLAAYEQALFEGHDPALPWAGRDAGGWARFAEDLEPKPAPKLVKPKAPPAPKAEKPKAAPKKAAAKK